MVFLELPSLAGTAPVHDHSARLKQLVPRVGYKMRPQLAETEVDERRLGGRLVILEVSRGEEVSL